MRTNKFSIFMGVAVLALIVGLNVRHALNDYGVTTNKLHLEVLAQTSTTGGGSTSGGGSGSGTAGITWNCVTIAVDRHEQSDYCYECGRTHISAVWITYDCNDGVFTWCYPGYKRIYYKCDGSVSSVDDNTEMSACW